MNIIVVEASGHVSFANCGLPYHVSGTIAERSALLLQTPESLRARFNLDVRVNTTATAIDRATRTITLRTADGAETTENYDYLVLSPGGRPILSAIPGIERALTLRTVEDLDRILAAITTTNPRTAALIGGGFIGLELAENLVKRGIEVTVLERGPHALSPLDTEMTAIVTSHLRDHGVRIETHANTTSLTDSAVHTEDGRLIPAELLIAAIGVSPRSELAVQAGLGVG